MEFPTVHLIYILYVQNLSIKIPFFYQKRIFFFLYKYTPKQFYSIIINHSTIL